jgi:hypothetical protein
MHHSLSHSVDEPWDSVLYRTLEARSFPALKAVTRWRVVNEDAPLADLYIMSRIMAARPWVPRSIAAPSLPPPSAAKSHPRPFIMTVADSIPDTLGLIFLGLILSSMWADFTRSLRGCSSLCM